ncbi:MAG: OmpA family protein [Ignavibacteria bacterium]|nr:OmpA family protein [Ignavibacteria bacterium]
MRWVLFALLLTAPMFAQVSYKDGSAIGFGISSPRLFGDVYSEYWNFGGHLLYQRDFDEVNSLRLKADFLKFTCRQDPVTGLQPKTTAIGLHVDYLYKFTPCSAVKMYFGTGVSAVNYQVDGAKDINNKWVVGELGITFIGGALFDLAPEWLLRAEFNHNTISTDKFDGVYGAQGGLFGGTLDSYTTMELGVMYYFNRGERTKYCDLPTGATTNYYSSGSNVDYDKIKKMIDDAQPKHIPADIDYAKIERMIDDKLAKIQPVVAEKKEAGEIVLVGINFDNNSPKIRPENYAILSQAAATLLANPSVKVEVQGYADAKGTEKKNQKLSQQRAERVKSYLVAKGVDASRLTLAAFGDKKPVADDKTSDGRALNRRVEFKIIK